MEPQALRFGGGTNVTLLHPLVAVAILVAIGLILLLSRKYIIVPLLLAIFLHSERSGDRTWRGALYSG